jgi:hypothetical protein
MSAPQERLAASQLRWVKGGKPLIGDVTIGSRVRAEVTRSQHEPAAFRLWRRRRLLAVQFAPFGRSKPYGELLVEERVGKIIRSEEFNVGAHRKPAATRYTFDVGFLPPRSAELGVVQEAKVERITRKPPMVLSGELGGDVIPGKAGATIPLTPEETLRETYRVKGAVDPTLEARILIPFAADPTYELMPYLVAAVVADTDDLLSGAGDVIEREVTAYVRSLVEVHDDPVADVVIDDEAVFHLGEGEQRTVDVVLRARSDGIGIFALALFNCDSETVELADPVVYAISPDRRVVTLYDALVDDSDEEHGEREPAPGDLSDAGTGSGAGEEVPVPAPKPVPAVAH